MTTTTDGTHIAIDTSNGHVDIHCYYDDSSYETAGWVAEYQVYLGASTEIVATDDSEKVWHPDMPLRANATSKAHRIARVYARRLLQKVVKRTRSQS